MNMPPYHPYSGWPYQVPYAPYPNMNGNGQMGDLRERVRGLEGDCAHLSERMDKQEALGLPERMARLETMKDTLIKVVSWLTILLVTVGMMTGALSVEQVKFLMGLPIAPPGPV